MEKNISIQIKGIAILFMIWLHCFHSGWYTDLYYDVTFMGDYLSCILTRLTGPVEFFIILSGYGLYCLYLKKGKINIWPRALKLYALFILCFAIFIPIGCFIKPEVYPGSTMEFISNITTWNTSYNNTWWFLFPYLLILTCSNYIFIFFEKFSMWGLIVSAFLYFIGYGISWLSAHAYIQVPYALHQLIITSNFLLPFIIGACLVKFDIIKKTKNWCAGKRNLYIFIIIVCIIIGIRLSTTFDFLLQIIYTLAIIFMYAVLPHYNITKKILQIFGKHSTSIWFTHAFFNMYLFTDYVYALRYPIYIYIGCVSISLTVAVIIDWGFSRLYSKIVYSLQ